MRLGAGEEEIPKMLSRWSFAAVFGGAVVLFASGCHSLQVKGPAQAQLGEPVPQAPTFIVEVREGKSQKSRVKQLPLTEPLTIQDLLEKTGTLSEFTRMNITIERRVPGQRYPLKLQVPFDPASRHVAMASNYAVHPGDRIIIAEDARTIIERLMDQAIDMMGPLAQM